MNSPQPAEQEHSRSVLQRMVSAPYRRVVTMLPDQSRRDRRLSDTGKVVLLAGLVVTFCVQCTWQLVDMFVFDPAYKDAMAVAAGEDRPWSAAMEAYRQLVGKWQNIMNYPFWVGFWCPPAGLVMIATGRVGLLRLVQWLWAGITGQPRRE